MMKTVIPRSIARALDSQSIHVKLKTLASKQLLTRQEQFYGLKAKSKNMTEVDGDCQVGKTNVSSKRVLLS